MEGKPDVLDYMCVFCQAMMVDPVTMTCKHSFCKLCLEQYIKILNADKKHLENEVSRDVEVKCPTCRQVKVLTTKALDKFVNKKLIKEIITHYKSDYQERRAEVLKDEKVENERKIHVKRIAVGNSYKPIGKPSSRRPDNKHNWRFFVRIEGEDRPEKYIEKVLIRLHPTFRPNKIWCKQSPYELSRVGWGTFDIPAVVYFKKKFNMKPLKVEHELSFDGAGSYHYYDVDFSKKKVKKEDDGEDEEED